MRLNTWRLRRFCVGALASALVTGNLVPIAVAWAQAVAQNLQMGETVLSADRAPADAPKKRGPNHPWVEISNLRKGSDGPWPTLQVDYKVTAGDVGSFTMVVKSDKGRSGASIHTFGKKQDTIHLRSFGFQSFPDNLEVWMEAEAGFGPFANNAGYKVSKSLTLGAVGQLTLAREWRPEEKTAYELSEKAKAPPPPPPAGFVVVDANTSPLLPGMPVLATHMAEWHEAEMLSVAPHQVTVKWSKPLTGRPEMATMARPRVAIATTTLETGKTAPTTFKPSVATLVNGTLAITDDLVPLTADINVLPGTPLKAEWGGRWDTVTATGKPRGDEVPITWDNWKGWNENRKLAMLAVEKSVVERLKQPDAATFYAKRLEELDHKVASRPQTPARDYPMRLALPKNATRLKDKFMVPEGTRLGAVWGSRWHELTVLSDSEEGPVECRWDGFGGNWVEWINRGSLAITKTEETKARNAAKKMAEDEATETSAASSKPAGGGYEIVLESVGASKIKVAKVVMEIAGLELKDALELANELPIPLKSSLTEDAAKALQKKIEAAGGKAKVQPQGE